MAGLVKPKCLRFSPTDDEVIRLFLEPEINGEARDNTCLIEDLDVYENHPDLLNHLPSDYFHKGEYWYFVPRKQKGSNLIKRTVGTGKKNGRWVHEKKIQIKEEGRIIGEKQKLIFKDKQNRHCGWHQYEYSLPSPQVLLAITHMIYKAEDDVTLANPFDESLPLMGTFGEAEALPIMQIAAAMEGPDVNMNPLEEDENTFEAIMNDFNHQLSTDVMEIDAVMEEPEVNAIPDEEEDVAATILAILNEMEQLYLQ